MPKGSEALTNARKEEIINACAKLYETMGFKDITIRDIGAETSFTRTSIYNYFQTKEEIFLALLQREHECWIADIKEMMMENDTMSVEEFADALARSLEKRGCMLKLMSMNLYDMEGCSRMENLVEFKKVFSGAINAIVQCFGKIFSQVWLPMIFRVLFMHFFRFCLAFTLIQRRQKSKKKRCGLPMFIMPRTLFMKLQNLLLKRCYEEGKETGTMKKWHRWLLTASVICCFGINGCQAEDTNSDETAALAETVAESETVAETTAESESAAETETESESISETAAQTETESSAQAIDAGDYLEGFFTVGSAAEHGTGRRAGSFQEKIPMLKTGFIWNGTAMRSA